MTSRTTRWVIYGSAAVFAFMGALAVLNGLFLVFANKFLLFLPEDARFIGMTATQISAYDPRLYDWAVIVYRLWGGFMFSTGVLTLWVALKPFLARERWAWYALAISTLPTLILWIVVNLPVQSYFLPALLAILVVYILALAGSYWVTCFNCPR